MLKGNTGLDTFPVFSLATLFTLMTALTTIDQLLNEFEITSCWFSFFVYAWSKLINIMAQHRVKISDSTCLGNLSGVI